MCSRHLLKLGSLYSAGPLKNVRLNGPSPFPAASDKFNFAYFSTGQKLHRRLSSLDHQIISKDDKRDFMAVFPDIVRDITKLEKNLPELSNWYVKVLQYNVSSGKNLRGMSVVYSYRFLAPNSLTPENVRISQILGWCVEMVQGFFIVLDDIIDESETRRGRPCWYKVPGVGLKALNDALLLESSIYKLLKQHLNGTPHYIPIMELFHETTLNTTIGQIIDTNTASLDGTQFEKINMDRYNFITTYKTSCYTFHLPVAIGMYLAGIFDKEMHRQAKTVLLAMGHYFQVQDDYLDVFGDIELTGKQGTDIKHGKCTWLAAVALQRASPSQRKLFEECYGKPEQEKIDKIKELFIEMGIPALYSTYEEDTYNLITTQIQQLSAGLPHDLFFGLLDRIHGRKH
ncbi:farnesyl pyrophosphate synthase [Cimex lectularius]|uniref:Farnesyl pyrophosphate synthase n=1 Tax=Cimex lectularius TaxID=79782 RepID=A0A8I6RE10_CIMLE|nr:farnesyl pyrophosphate synthase [Cimex lectularius]